MLVGKVSSSVLFACSCGRLTHQRRVVFSDDLAVQSHIQHIKAVTNLNVTFASNSNVMQTQGIATAHLPIVLYVITEA